MTNYIDGPRTAWSRLHPILTFFALIPAIMAGMLVPVQAQADQFTRPSWWVGAAAAANLNFYRGSTQQLNSAFTSPVAFDHGNGVGLYVAPLLEYHVPGTKFGAGLQAGYDSRRSGYNTVTAPCNCPADLSTNLSYLTIEPSLRFAPFRSNFYLFGGPRFAFNLAKSFTYKLGINPDTPDQEPTPDVKGELGDIRKTLISMQIGAGYDIPLTSTSRRTQFVLSPFISFHPYFGQSPRSVETWTVSTLRAGAALKLGHGRKITATAFESEAYHDPEVRFWVNSPKNIPVERSVREVFPVRNYVFFDIGTTEIPARYVKLRQNQVKDFKEDQLDMFKPVNLSPRSEQQMVVYYNVLNILGDRMGKYPSSSITLAGSSEKDPEDGKAMAESVRDYLVNVFGIDASRIRTEGISKPKIPSGQPGGTLELDLLRASNRRVSIESTTADLLMEFQSGPYAPLKPVEIRVIREAPPESYVTFNVEGGKEAFSSWTLEVRDEKGVLQNFGPYTQEKVSLPGKSILGDRPEGHYNITMAGKMKNGQSIRKEIPVHVVLWTPIKDTESMRYSILYEFNESKAVTMYEKYITDVVTPRIPQGGKVVIRGYTDIIGDEANNLRLSLSRANDVRGFFENGLKKANRNDVTFEVKGFGEDQSLSPFENKFPEERFYNRTVVIDIHPGK